MLLEGKTYSRRFVCPTVYLSHFCPPHISKSIEGYLLKLDTLIEGHKEKLQNVRTVILSTVFTELFPLFNNTNINFVGLKGN